MFAPDLPPTATGGFVTNWIELPTGAPRRLSLKWLLQRITKYILWAYLRLVHDFKIRYHPGIPRGRPYIAVVNHTSVLDVPALMAANPYEPPTAMVVKSNMMRVPVVSWILRLWDAIPVDRTGRDVGPLRQMRRLLGEGRGICIVPAGTRSADGRLGPVSPVLIRFIIDSDVAVFPVVIVGAMECLPKGSRRLRPGKIYVDSGPEIDLRRFRGHRLGEAELTEAAGLIQNSIAALLPDYMKPEPGAPVLGRFVAEG